MIPHSRPTIGDEEVAAAERVLRSGHLAQGREVEALEAECASFVSRKYGVAVNSGTAALHLALAALEFGPGRTAAVPAYACASLLHAVHLSGASVELTDVGEDANLDRACLNGRHHGGIVAHLFGAPAAIPGTHPFIEDIAQSLGGDTGRATPIAVASFYATKLMTTGEGGMLLTDDPTIAEFARDRRDYDNRDDFVTRYPYKMTDLQAAIGREQLRKLPRFVERRREIAASYREALKETPVTLPGGDAHVYFRFVLRTPERDAAIGRLAERGVEAKRPVHRPLHHVFVAKPPDFVHLNAAYPNADLWHETALSLPIYPALTDAETQRVIDATLAVLGG